MLYIMSNTIYIFKLEESKLFLHVCNPTNKTDLHISLEAELYYDYLKKYKPISIFTKIADVDMLNVDNYVKKYMICFGVDNVRGGSYIDEILPEYQTLALACEFETVINKRKNMDEIYSMINNHVGQLSKIEEKKMQLQNQYDTYVKEVNELKRWQIRPEIIQDIAWLKSIILQKYQTEITREDIAKYKRLLVDLKRVYSIYTENICSVFDESKFHWYNKDCFLFLKYPEFLLDDFFYYFIPFRFKKPQLVSCSSFVGVVNERMSDSSRLDISVQYGEQFCHMFTYLTNTIINKMQEAQFDVDTWNKEIEWTTPRAIYLLDKIAASIQ